MPRRQRGIKGEGTVRKRPDGRYEGRLWLRDGTRVSVYGTNEREVTREIRQLKAQDEAGKAIVRKDQRLLHPDGARAHAARARVYEAQGTVGASRAGLA